MYYEFYIDQFFAEQFVIGCFLLAAAGGLLGIRPTWRLAVGSLINAAGMSIEIITGLTWLYPFILFAVIMAAYWEKDAPGRWKRLRSCTFCLLVVTVFFGGALEAMLAFVPVPVIAAAVVIPAGLYGLLQIAKRGIQKSERLASVTVCLDGMQIDLLGLWDTGNQLKEPLTGCPVSIVDEEALKSILGDTWEEKRGFFLVPYHSLGTEDGWLRGVTFDEMRVTMRRGSRAFCRPVIALYNGNVSARKEYQMILHPEHAP